ncbi:MAG: hypothetical protein WCO00_06815 [Rhodospirillaceae bacterium]
MTPVVRQAVPPPQPYQGTATAANAALLVAQNVPLQTRTQTAGALQAAGSADQTRTGQSRKNTGETVDSNTNAVTARSNGGGGRGGSAPQRGGGLDVRV